MSVNIELQPIEQPIESQSTTNKRNSKYDNDEEHHNAIKAQKRSWYWKNSDKQKLKSLKSYYQKQLQRQDLKENLRTKYESKLNELNEKLGLINNLI